MSTSRISVGREIRSEWGWMWARTKRLADLLREPRILAGAVDTVEALDRWCAMKGEDPARVQLGDAKFIKGLQYVEYPLERE